MQIKRALVVFRNILFFIAVLIIFLLLMFLFEDYSMQLPIRIVTIVFVIEVVLFFVSVVFSQFSMLKYSGDIISCGDKVKISIFLNKRGLYPFKKVEIILWYKNIYDGKIIRKKIQIELSDKICQKHDIEIEANHCGYLNIGIENAYIYDMFAFLSFKCKIKNGQSMLMVLPKITPIAVDFNDFKRIAIDEEEVFRGDIERKGLMDKYEIREFIPGDSLNRIHWKLTAKNDEFMVKDYKDFECINTYVYFDLRKGINIDKMYEDAISMVYLLIQNKIIFYAIWVQYDDVFGRYTLKRKKIKGEADALEVLSIIMKVKLFTDDFEINNLLGQIVNSDGSINYTFIV